MARGQVEVKSLSWDRGHVEVVLQSAISQNIQLRFSHSAKSITDVSTGKKQSTSVALPAKQNVNLSIELE